MTQSDVVLNGMRVYKYRLNSQKFGGDVNLVKTLTLGNVNNFTDKSVVQNGDFVYFFDIHDEQISLKKFNLLTFEESQLFAF